MPIEQCQRCLENPSCSGEVHNGCLPVPFFGDIKTPHLKVVTVGLNPALNEFVVNDSSKPRTERLAMLADYGHEQRADLTESEIAEAQARREKYFRDHLRDWHSYFDKMESILTRVKPAWTYGFGSAVHIDVVACATRNRWGNLTNKCQEAMIANCRDHFETAISGLPNGTVILCDGRRATREVASLDKNNKLRQAFINVREPGRGDLGWVGELHLNVKKFPVRGWSSQVTHLSAVWRINLANWIHCTFQPPNTWPPLEATKKQ
jgi:hypothetical protein